MVPVDRRTVLRLGGIALGTALAGCSGDDGPEADETTTAPDTEDGSDGSDETDTPAETPTETPTETDDGTDGTETEPETTDTGPETLIVNLENEDGDPVWTGVTISVTLPGSPSRTYNASPADLETTEGQVVIENQDRPGEYEIVVETEDGETIVDEVTVPEGGEEEVAIVVEGHPGDTPTETDA